MEATERFETEAVVEVGGDTAEVPVDDDGIIAETGVATGGSEKVKAGRERVGKLITDDTVVGKQIGEDIDTVEVDNVVTDVEEDI